ncbi:hypothetical protein N7448_002404 [Penicillium atrosanguineum]|uniref:Uncharacterized protein n=1 Tax=Penicillium atrosanguineum TaxID=1132637 RepID=A0A9W9PU21_9EURO|nr:hypothetical protein N7526_006853 [Penicillium atrosanguineum]KAJ5145012.1 hypothetical protein N7448_002404 [Penicillium atrosanguineum]KAJ5311446.1 hypothetical protein N7476_007306 [Penicillium atrosanguineum]
MAATTHFEFNANTEGLEVTKAFFSQIRGKSVIITGVNRGGIGFSTAQALAAQSPAKLIIAGRSPSKIQECIEVLKADSPDVSYRALQMDLSSQKSVRTAAAEVLAWNDLPAMDILLNSAGVMGVQERTLTEDGIELHFATNHIGHWLFTCLIMPKMIEASKHNPKGATRIVNVSSGSPGMSNMRWSDMNFDRMNKELPEEEQPIEQPFKVWGYKDIGEARYIPLDGYNRSKVANVLFSIGATKRLYEKHGIVSLAVHPGVIPTELGRNFAAETLEAIKKMSESGVFTYKTLGAGASTSLVAALDPKLGDGARETKNGTEHWGVFLADCQISDSTRPLAVSSQEAEKLWEVSEKLVGQSFAW